MFYRTNYLTGTHPETQISRIIWQLINDIHYLHTLYYSYFIPGPFFWFFNFEHQVKGMRKESIIWKTKFKDREIFSNLSYSLCLVSSVFTPDYTILLFSQKNGYIPILTLYIQIQLLDYSYS